MLVNVKTVATPFFILMEKIPICTVDLYKEKKTLIFQRFTSMHLDILASFANTLSPAEAFPPS